MAQGCLQCACRHLSIISPSPFSCSSVLAPVFLAVPWRSLRDHSRLRPHWLWRPRLPAELSRPRSAGQAHSARGRAVWLPQRTCFASVWESTGFSPATVLFGAGACSWNFLFHWAWGFLSARVSELCGAGLFSSLRGVTTLFICLSWLLSQCWVCPWASFPPKWFADWISLHIMLTDSSLALKRMLSFPSLVWRCLAWRSLLLGSLICSALRSQIPFGLSVWYLSNFQVFFWTWTDEDQISWPETSCTISDDFGAREVWFVASVRLVRNGSLGHHAHERDAGGIRFCGALFCDGVVCRWNVLYSFQQLHRCRPDAELVIEELRFDSFGGKRPAFSSMIFPSRSKLVCCVAHRVRSHTPNWVGEHVHISQMDVQLDGVDGTDHFPTSFLESLISLIFGAEGFPLRLKSPDCQEGYPRCTECIEVRAILFRRTQWVSPWRARTFNSGWGCFTELRWGFQSRAWGSQWVALSFPTRALSHNSVRGGFGLFVPGSTLEVALWAVGVRHSTRGERAAVKVQIRWWMNVERTPGQNVFPVVLLCVHVKWKLNDPFGFFQMDNPGQHGECKKRASGLGFVHRWSCKWQLHCLQTCSLECWTGRGQPYQMTKNQQHEQESDVWHLGWNCS